MRPEEQRRPSAQNPTGRNRPGAGWPDPARNLKFRIADDPKSIGAASHEERQGKPEAPKQLCSAEEAGGQQRSGIASINSLGRVRARELVSMPGLQTSNSNRRVIDVANHHRSISV